jgi:hypothetical protein
MTNFVLWKPSWHLMPPTHLLLNLSMSRITIAALANWVQMTNSAKLQRLENAYALQVTARQEHMIAEIERVT